ncbi:MAG: histidine kinase [Brachybacterium sp.]|nr:histidine kinase [Brachybacterium sp.]
MDDRSAPRRRWWQESLLVLAGLGEAALFLVLAERGWEYVQGILVVVLVGALLLRFGRWRWLLPAVLVANLAAWSAVVGVVALYSYATREPRRSLTLLMTLLSFGSMVVPVALNVYDEGTSRQMLLGLLAAGLVATALVAVAGMYRGARRELLHGLQQRAEVAENRTQEAEESARRAERTRIAREMHDIVAHKISLVALQAGALEVNRTLERDQVVASAGLIRSTATQALNELREVLGVLRSDDDEAAPLMPQPSWEDVRRLVATTRDAGVRVDLYDFIDEQVPDQLARTAYRVVQESLTNVHKHARHTAVRVALIGENGGELVIEVSNVLPEGFATDLPGARMGLSGIETRVRLAGGSITSGPTDDGRFQVRAVIPWPAATT